MIQSLPFGSSQTASNHLTTDTLKTNEQVRIVPYDCAEDKELAQRAVAILVMRPGRFLFQLELWRGVGPMKAANSARSRTRSCLGS